MRARLCLLAVCATVSFALIGQLGVTASSDGPAIQGVKLREGLQHAAEHPGDVLGKAAQYVKDLAADKAGGQASTKPAVEAVKLRKGLHDDEAGDAKKGPAIEPVKLKAQSGGPAITPVKLRQAVQDAAADPGAALGNAAQYVQDLATDKTAAKADGFFDAMEARARRELKYWRSMGAAGVFQHYYGWAKDLTLDGFAAAETKLLEFNKVSGGFSGLFATLQQYVEGWVVQAKDAIARMQGHATSTGDAAARAAQGKAEDVMGSAQDATRGVRSAAQDMKNTAAETVKGVRDSAQETAEEIRQRGEL